MYELKIYRGVMCHDNEEWCKIWREIDLPFQNWHEEFDEFWTKHLKLSKIFTLIGSIWTKYMTFELENYNGVMFHDNKKRCKIWGGIDLPFLNWHQNLTSFDPNTGMLQKISSLRTPFDQSI